MIAESLRASCHFYSKESEVSGGNMYNLCGLCGRDAITVPTLSKVLHSCDIHERGSPTIRLVSLATKTHFPCTESQSVTVPGCPQYPQSYENTDTQWELLATQEIQLPVEMTNFLMSNDATETKSRLMLTM